MFINTTVRLYTGTFKALFSNFENFLKICWAWFALMFVIQTAFGLITFGETQPTNPVTTGLLAGNAVFFLLSVVSSASIAVAWHRCLLLEEVPSIIHLKVGARELIYVFKFIMVLFIVALMFVPVIALIVVFVGSDAGGAGFLVAVISILGIAIIMTLYMRLSLVLPAASLDERLTLSDAYSKSRGLGWPMMLAGLAASMTILLPVGVLFMLVTLSGGGVLVLIAMTILMIGVQVCFTALQIGIFTGGYFILREREMAEQNPPPPGGGLSSE